MKLKDIIDKLQLRILTDLCPVDELLDRTPQGVYICDLLSWVMSHAKKDDIWITVQIHPNIIAVASLLELSCVIIPEGIEVDDITLNKAKENRIMLLRWDKDSYSLICKLKELGL